MSIKTMDYLFVATLKDIYYAEKQILKALPGMVKKAKSGELKKALETHRQETEGQVERLDQAFKMLDVPARGKKCEAIEGIIDEAKEHMEEIEDEQVLDAGMISSAQAVEHYEICRYGTLGPSRCDQPAAAKSRRGEERRSFAESDRQGFIEPEGRGRGMKLSLARRA